MDQGVWDALVGWIGTHPVAAGGVVFLLAFCDAIVVLGIVVPLAPLFLAIGAMMGLGTLHPGYTVLCAAAGAFFGDLAGYAVGRRYGEGLRRIWPFSRHPGWLSSGEAFMRRHGRKGIVIGRYVGAVRPFVPAIVGMAGLPLRRYILVSTIACLSWAALYLAPGWLFGASFEVLRAVGGRLAVVALGLLLAMAALAWTAHRLHALLAPRGRAAAESILSWSRRHPFWGRLTAPLVDPNLPESPSVAVWALVLTLACLMWLSMLGWLSDAAGPLAFDVSLRHLWTSMRTPLLYPLLATATLLGDRVMWLPASAILGAFLTWRGRRAAALHWLAAVGLGWCLVIVLSLLIGERGAAWDVSALGGGFPSEPITMATIVGGFFAILVAREMPGRDRDWPYVVATLWVAALCASRLYFGVEWASQALSSVLLGLSWIAVVGIAYRRRRTRPFWILPPTAVFFVAMGMCAAWRASDWAGRLELLSTPPAAERWTQNAWTHGAWAALGAQRADGPGDADWPLDVQYAGPLDQLVSRMRREGWRPVYPLGWRGVLLGLRPDLSDEDLPWLVAAHEGHGTALVLARRQGDEDIEQTLHLWPTHVEIVGVGPLWLGSRGRMAPSQISAWFRYRARLPASDRGDDEWPAGLVAIRRAGAEANGAMWLLRISDRQAAE